MDQELKNSILKSGTTILGIVCKDGVVMAADRQSTLGSSIVASKRSRKVKQINDYVLISGTGSVSDIQRTEKVIPSELKLKELRSKSRPTMKQVASLLSSYLYTNIRQPSMVTSMAGFLVAGFDEDCSTHLYSVFPDGSSVEVEDYDANLGSGMPYVLGLLERLWKKGMSMKEGVELAIEALKSSTQRDTGSGYGIDVFTITKEGIKQVVEQEITAEYKERKK